jgi:predicted RNA-binding Zn-ribbon protein involved in translation (DUF1610 family)/DNA-binding XRE family transcriptional regulator
MNLTPDHLKIFRRHFALTQEQAADLIKETKRTWWHWETGNTPVPPLASKRIRMWMGRLTVALKHKDNRCPYCLKDITAARAKNSMHCPYCGRHTGRSKKCRIQEVLPIKNI